MQTYKSTPYLNTLPTWALETSYSASTLQVSDYHGKQATCEATVAIWVSRCLSTLRRARPPAVTPCIGSVLLACWLRSLSQHDVAPAALAAPDAQCTCLRRMTPRQPSLAAV